MISVWTVEWESKVWAPGWGNIVFFCFYRLEESNGNTEGLFSYKSREKSISSGNSQLALLKNISVFLFFNHWSCKMEGSHILNLNLCPFYRWLRLPLRNLCHLVLIAMIKRYKNINITLNRIRVAPLILKQVIIYHLKWLLNNGCWIILQSNVPYFFYEFAHSVSVTRSFENLPYF